jgi:hypothetical protein
MIQEEQRRLTAAWLNIVAAGVISAGAVAPIVTVLIAQISGQVSWAIALAAFSIFCGVGLHLAGRAVLGSSQQGGATVAGSQEQSRNKS